MHTNLTEKCLIEIIQSDFSIFFVFYLVKNAVKSVRDDYDCNWELFIDMWCAFENKIFSSKKHEEKWNEEEKYVSAEIYYNIYISNKM